MIVDSQRHGMVVPARSSGFCMPYRQRFSWLCKPERTLWACVVQVTTGLTFWGCVLQFSDPLVAEANSTFLLGPVAGPTAPSSATKSEHFMLPANVRLPATSGPEAAPSLSAAPQPGTQRRSAATAGAPGPSAAARVLAKAPPPGQQPGTGRAAAAAAGGPAGLIRQPGQLAPARAPSMAGVAAASRQPSGGVTAGVAAPRQAPAPGTELVAWASKWEGPGGQVLRSASSALPPVSRSAAPAPLVGFVSAASLPPAPMGAVARMASPPGPSLSPNVQVSVPVTTPVAAPTLATPKRTAILYTSDGV